MLATCFVAATLSSVVADSPVIGRVAATESRWDGDAIVTQSEIRDEQGRATIVVQLGGVVDGIGMVYSHQPDVLREGQLVAIDVAPARTATGVEALVVVAARPLIAQATQGGTAAYGVQRTQRSKVPLWRASGCIDVTYDGASVSQKTAAVLDQAFETWETATLSCGGPSFLAIRAPSAFASTTDDRNTVQLRAERWCRPASATVPELCYPRDASAVTRLRFVDDPAAPDDGQILDADMELNAVDFALLAPGEMPPAGAKTGVDLLGVATHEAGHVLGLGHNCGTALETWPTDHAGNAVPSCDQPADSPVVLATMFYRIAPGDTHERTIEAGDKAGACSLAHGETCERFIEGGCSSTAGSRFWLAAVVALIIRRRRRRRTAR